MPAPARSASWKSDPRLTTTRRWIGPVDARAQLAKRWARGEFLSNHARGFGWQPVAVSLRPPSAAELASDFGAVQNWVTAWQGAAAARWRVEYRSVGGRLIGANALPSRAWIDSYDDLWHVLAVADDVRRFGALLSSTADSFSAATELTEWMVSHPMAVLGEAEVWPQLLGVVEWALSGRGAGRYIREIDVPGVDTKFVERHRAILCELLDRTLSPERIDTEQPRTAFERRYRFARKPQYVRMRRLDDRGLLSQPGEPAERSGPAELTVRVGDLVRQPIACRAVIVVENEVTYLALPKLRDVVAIHGSGYRASNMESLSWLRDRDLVYWGDIDTHGFRILDRVRSLFPHTDSILMNRETLLSHEAKWGREDTPTTGRLSTLTESEATLYVDLVEGRYQPHLRLEQERVDFLMVESALAERLR